MMAEFTERETRPLYTPLLQRSTDQAMDDADFEFETTAEDLGNRLDSVICLRAAGVSRARVKLLIQNKKVTVEGRASKPSMQMRPGQKVVVELSQLESLRPARPQAEDIPLDILLEDDQLIVVNKPPAMVVHPAKGHWSGTLTAGLMYHFENLSSIGGDHRPGIVHRLDRDTSGVIVIAKNDQAHTHLMRQFEKRTVQKKYIAVVSGAPDRDRDRIEAPIGQHPYQRERMAVRAGHKSSKAARTFYEVQERLGRFAVVHAFPKTGRTHQIRVHLAHINAPVLADRLYSGRAFVTPGWLKCGVDEGPRILERQALHASSIEFEHPTTGDMITVSAPLPADIKALIECLRELYGC